MGGGGGPQCRLSILRNAHVPCHYFCNVHVDFKKVSFCLSNLRNTLCHVVYFYPPVTRLYMSHVDFKNWPCRRVEVKGQDPKRGTNMALLESKQSLIRRGHVVTVFLWD